MTTAEVKEQLPYVDILWNGKLYVGRVSGRLNSFASVSVCGKPTRRKSKTFGGYWVDPMLGPIFQYAWQTIADAITNGKPLRT